MAQLSLAQQLAAAGLVKEEVLDRHEQEQFEADAKIEKKLKDKFHGRSTGSVGRKNFYNDFSGVPNNIQIGDTILGKALIHSENTEGNEGHASVRPYHICGIYRCPKGNVKALDLFVSTGKFNPKGFSGSLLISSEHEQRVSGIKVQKPNKAMSIKTDTIFTIENRSVGSRGYILDEAGIRASMNPAIIPDLMVRRIQVLLFGRDTVNRTFVKIDKSWTREGFLFDKINPNNIWDQRARQQPDINWGDDEPHFKRTLYLPEGLTKIDVEKIQDYAR